MVIEEIRKYNKQLIAKYPWLLPRNRWTGEVIEDYDYSYTELDDMPDELRKEMYLCAKEIQQELNIMEPYQAADFRIVQIKEKYGSLRFYTNWVTDAINNVIYKYEKLSEHTCISCGAPATKISIGWISPWCDKCAEKLHAKFVKIAEKNT